LDVRLAEEGHYPSREKARVAIMAGLIFVNGEKADKPGTMVKPESNIEVRGSSLIYVSRGGLKLEKAIKSFGLNLNNRVVLDAGASTGGFTDCALRNGARLVYAVDVGYGQLAWKLRNDDRVVVLERTNIRYLTKESLPETPDIATIDVSFISLSKVLPRIGELTAAEAEVVALVKPQFEAGRDKVGKKGVVREPAIHTEVLNAVAALIKDLGWMIGGLDYSPVTGPEGNIEFLIYIKKKGLQTECNIDDVVKKAHVNFGYIQS
jgi:23S rRNA (cytidine1920-2'-O)/16S rRNA (cytidine1409-2'-O)-methyltransferase